MRLDDVIHNATQDCTVDIFPFFKVVSVISLMSV